MLIEYGQIVRCKDTQNVDATTETDIYIYIHYANINLNQKPALLRTQTFDLLLAHIDYAKYV